MLVNTRGIYSALRGWKLQLRDIHGSALKRCRFALAPAPQEMITRSGPQILLIITVVVVVVVCDEGAQEDGVGHIQHLVNRAGKKVEQV